MHLFSLALVILYYSVYFEDLLYLIKMKLLFTFSMINFKRVFLKIMIFKVGKHFYSRTTALILIRNTFGVSNATNRISFVFSILSEI